MQKTWIHPTWLRQAALVTAGLCFGLTIGCGGGGGGSSTPAAPSVSLSLVSPTSIQATVNEGSQMPNQTVTVQATGDLNSLAGKQIYVGIVDPDSLFNLPATLTAVTGSNGTYSATLPGKALTVVGSFQGNLQINVSTSSTFTSQLGNCPLSLPFSVTVNPASVPVNPTPTTITGTSRVTNLAFDAGSGAIAPATPAPFPLAVVEAILPSGSVVTGTYNSSTGAFTVPSAVTGTYVLHAGDSYLWTTSTSVSMDWQRGGRNPALDNASTLHTFDLINMIAWAPNDYLLAFDFNSGLYRSWSNVTNGATSDHSALGWLGYPLVDTTLGDAPQIVQYATSMSGQILTCNAVASGSIPITAMGSGIDSVLVVPLSPVPATIPVDVAFKRSQFAGYHSEYNPHASLSTPFFEVDSTPGASAYGNAGQWLDGYSWQDLDATNTSDVNLAAQAMTPMPIGFERIFYAGESHFLDLLAPGASSPCTIKVKGLRSYTLTPPSSTSPLQALVSPVTGPKINGSDLFQDQTGVGLTPTLSWNTPDLGSPNAYEITIYQLQNASGVTASAQVARLFLPGSMTSATLPAGILQNGNAYCFLITAYVDSSYDPTTAPWATHKFPYGMSQAISSVVIP